MTDYKHKYYKYKKKYLDIVNKSNSPKIANYGSSNLINQTVENFTSNGATSVKNSRVKTKLLVNGSLSFTNLKVGKIATVNGEASGKDGKFEILTVDGSCSLKNSSINNLIVNGSLDITNSTINKIKLSGGASLKKSKIKQLIIDNQHSYAKNNINLQKTNINELIVKGEEMRIYASQDSKINKVTNAIIIRN